MGVDVDESRRDDEPGRVDHLARVELRDRADGGDAPGLDRNVSPPRRSAGAVDDLTAGNQQVIARLDLAAGRWPSRKRADRTIKSDVD